MIGQNISHYEVLEKLGKGGMGEVYKAQDIVLKRVVALKMVRPEAIGDPEARERFYREAMAASALNHPNITTIYEVDQWFDRDFISMEYVSGHTLKEMSKSGPLDLKKVIDIATQIADALEEAHSQGIIHRDIKSDNVMVTEKGLVKVMDFGLAKITGQTQLTRTGSTLGTLSYMSPEQIQGKQVDRRSDIFSFGVVLYEMLAGQLPFKGEYEAAVTYSIVNKEPYPLEELRSNLSPVLLSLVNRILEKDPDVRIQSMKKIKTILKQVQQALEKRGSVIGSEEESLEDTDLRSPVTDKMMSPALTEKQAGKKWKRWILLAVIVAGLSLGAFVIIKIIPFFEEEQALPMKIVPLAANKGSERKPSFSPDGNQIVFCWDGANEDNWDIYHKVLGSDVPRNLTDHPARDIAPVWSPDQRYIAFIRWLESEGELGIYRIPISGGKASRLIPFNKDSNIGFRLLTLSWSPNGNLIAFPHKVSTRPIMIYTLNIKTNERKQLTSCLEMAIGDLFPAFSPDGKWLAFCRFSNTRLGVIYIVSLSDGREEKITFDKKYVRGLTWTSDSREIIFSSNRQGTQGLWRVSMKDRSIKPVTVNDQNPQFPSISSLGHRLAYVKSLGIGSNDLWQLEISQPGRRVLSKSRLTHSSVSDGDPEYSPDGKRIVFKSKRSGETQLWTCDFDGNNRVKLTSAKNPFDPKWSHDGKYIAYEADGLVQNIYEISSAGGMAKKLTNDASSDGNPSYSRDNQYIYYRSSRGGRFEIWKIRRDNGETIQVTKNGGTFAIESFDGKWLYYSKNDSSGIWKIPIEGGEVLNVVDLPIKDHDWDVANDGIYYHRPKGSGVVFEFFNFADDTIEKITEIDRFIWNISITQDGRWIIYEERTPELGTEIMLVENFR
ncbi:hypothetical protein BVY01_01965 [bacterium I07]|nr:hypothetical protein BVY01_01965 [bacterium I07]